MKTTLLSLASLLVILSACSNERDVIEGSEKPVVDAPVFTATIEGDEVTRTSISEGSASGKMKVEWLSSDKVFVLGFDVESALTIAGAYSVTPDSPATSATLNPETVMYNTGAEIAKVFATYPSTISFLYDLPESSYQTPSLVANNYRDVFLPSTQTYNDGNISQVAPMAAEVTGGVTDLKFKNITALLAIKILSDDFSSVSQIKVSTDKQLVDRFTINENFDCESISSDASHKTVTLDCTKDGQATTIASGETKTFYVSIPANTYGFINVEVTDGVSTMSMRTRAASISVARNKIYPINFENDDPNLLSGKFSVSATKRVKFTKGNLYWDGSAFKFENNQTGRKTSWEDTHVSHFYWSKNASVLYQQSFSDQQAEEDAFFFCYDNRNDEANKVENSTGLYVLTKEEWRYLLNLDNESSSVRQGNRYAKGVIDGINGLLLFPDNYSGTTSGTGIASPNTKNAAFPSASIPSDTWATMESAGVVFLPCAGNREGNKYTFTHEGSYWSSTSNGFYPPYLAIESDGIATYVINRDQGLSLRLVATAR